MLRVAVPVAVVTWGRSCCESSSAPKGDTDGGHVRAIDDQPLARVYPTCAVSRTSPSMISTPSAWPRRPTPCSWPAHNETRNRRCPILRRRGVRVIDLSATIGGSRLTVLYKAPHIDPRGWPKACTVPGLPKGHRGGRVVGRARCYPTGACWHHAAPQGRLATHHGSGHRRQVGGDRAGAQRRGIIRCTLRRGQREHAGYGIAQTPAHAGESRGAERAGRPARAVSFPRTWSAQSRALNHRSGAARGRRLHADLLADYREFYADGRSSVTRGRTTDERAGGRLELLRPDRGRRPPDRPARLVSAIATSARGSPTRPET